MTLQATPTRSRSCTCTMPTGLPLSTTNSAVMREVLSSSRAAEESMSCLAEGADSAKPLREWVKLGVVRTRGREFPADVMDAQAFLLTPAGAYGPAFLAMENFLVIKRYNMVKLPACAPTPAAPMMVKR